MGKFPVARVVVQRFTTDASQAPSTVFGKVRCGVRRQIRSSVSRPTFCSFISIRWRVDFVIPSFLRWSIESETRIRHTSLSPKALPRNSSRVAGRVHRRWTASSQTRTYRFRVKRDTPRSPYAARFSVMTGRCFLPCRNSSLTCTAPLVDSIGAGGEAQGNVLGQRGRGSNLGCSHAGDRSR